MKNWVLKFGNFVIWSEFRFNNLVKIHNKLFMQSKSLIEMREISH